MNYCACFDRRIEKELRESIMELDRLRKSADQYEKLLLAGLQLGKRCREVPMKETQILVRSVDEAGNKMVNEYVRESKIGYGKYGKMALYRSARDGKQYCIKDFLKSQLLKLRVGSSETSMSDVLREVSIMKTLDHPNIVSLIEVIDDPNTNNFYMVLEYVEGKCVGDGSGPSSGSGETTIRKYLRDIIAGLMYLHANVQQSGSQVQQSGSLPGPSQQYRPLPFIPPQYVLPPPWLPPHECEHLQPQAYVQFWQVYLQPFLILSLQHGPGVRNRWGQIVSNTASRITIHGLWAGVNIINNLLWFDRTMGNNFSLIQRATTDWPNVLDCVLPHLTTFAHNRWLWEREWKVHGFACRMNQTEYMLFTLQWFDGVKVFVNSRLRFRCNRRGKLDVNAFIRDLKACRMEPSIHIWRKEYLRPDQTKYIRQELQEVRIYCTSVVPTVTALPLPAMLQSNYNPAQPIYVL